MESRKLILSAQEPFPCLATCACHHDPHFPLARLGLLTAYSGLPKRCRWEGFSLSFSAGGFTRASPANATFPAARTSFQRQARGPNLGSGSAMSSRESWVQVGLAADAKDHCWWLTGWLAGSAQKSRLRFGKLTSKLKPLMGMDGGAAVVLGTFSIVALANSNTKLGVLL